MGSPTEPRMRRVLRSYFSMKESSVLVEGQKGVVGGAASAAAHAPLQVPLAPPHRASSGGEGPSVPCKTA